MVGCILGVFKSLSYHCFNYGCLGKGHNPAQTLTSPKQALVWMCLQYKSFENTVRKGKIALNSLPNDKILDQSKFKAFAEEKMVLTQISDFVLGRVENITGKGGNAGRKKKKGFSPFPTMFSKAFFAKGVKSRDCVVKG